MNLSAQNRSRSTACYMSHPDEWPACPSSFFPFPPDLCRKVMLPTRENRAKVCALSGLMVVCKCPPSDLACRSDTSSKSALEATHEASTRMFQECRDEGFSDSKALSLSLFLAVGPVEGVLNVVKLADIQRVGGGGGGAASSKTQCLSRAVRIPIKTARRDANPGVRGWLLVDPESTSRALPLYRLGWGVSCTAGGASSCQKQSTSLELIERTTYNTEKHETLLVGETAHELSLLPLLLLPCLPTLERGTTGTNLWRLGAISTNNSIPED